MDTRIMLDYIRRQAWGYGAAILLYLAYGFYTGKQPVITMLFMMFFLIIGIAPELQRQGPLWLHRTLPVREQVLMRTVWWLAVVMPVITLATSFLPALAFGLVTGRSNTATTHLITFIAAGFLLTSVSFLYLNLGNFEWKSRLVRGYVVLGATLLMFTGMFFVVASELDWNAMHLRLGLIVTAPLLVMLSYVFAPHVMSAAGPNTNGQRTLQPGKSQTKNTMSMRDRILATPSGRALVGGLFLPGLALCMHLIVAQQLGQFDWWNLPAGHKFMVWGIGMLPFLLYLGSTPHMTSFRGMASLPISRTRRTLTFVRLPVAAVVPLVMFLTTLAVFAKTNSTGYLQLTAVVLYCLMSAYVGIALRVRGGSVAAIFGVIVMSQVLIVRLVFAGIAAIPSLSTLDILIPLSVIMLTCLWIHHSLSRQTNAYRRDWFLPALQRG